MNSRMKQTLKKKHCTPANTDTSQAAKEVPMDQTLWWGVIPVVQF